MKLSNEKTETTPDFLAEAIKIGDVIINACQNDNNGSYWLFQDHTGRIDVGINFYSGNSGTIFFLIELYKKTKDKKYLDTIISSINWLLNNFHAQNQNNLAFYCGSGGVIYILLEAFKITGNELYKTSALNIGRNYNSVSLNSDILYGSSGAILTLLHLHNETNEDWIIDEISRKVEQLFNDAIFPQRGVCWERGGGEIHPLCGFAHGASGIAFVFLELYRYFKNDVFRTIAEMAFDYEDQYFQKNSNNVYQQFNWPDLRKDTNTDEYLQKLIQSYLNNNMEEFTSVSYMSAWCHGAPGIGMARLHAYKTTNRKKHFTYFQHALKNTINTISSDPRNFTLCHGALGNADLLIEAYIVNKDKYSYAIAINEAQKSFLYKEQYGFFTSGISRVGAEADCNLLNGKAGIGQFYLRLHDPFNTCSALAPVLREIKRMPDPLTKYSKSFLIELIYNKTLPNTSLILHSKDHLNIDDSEYLSKEKIIKTIQKVVAEKNDNTLTNTFSLDLLGKKIIDNISSDNYLYIKDLVEKRKFNETKYDKLSLTDMLKKELILNPVAHLEKQVYPNHVLYIILFVNPINDPLSQYIIGEYLFDLLNTFKEQTSIDNSYRTLIRKYFTLHKSAVNFNQNYKAQLKICIANGLLLLNSSI